MNRIAVPPSALVRSVIVADRPRPADLLPVYPASAENRRERRSCLYREGVSADDRRQVTLESQTPDPSREVEDMDRVTRHLLLPAIAPAAILTVPLALLVGPLA